eukprot:272244-Alexandrium_andersonii.AAC.1
MAKHRRMEGPARTARETHAALQDPSQCQGLQRQMLQAPRRPRLPIPERRWSAGGVAPAKAWQSETPSWQNQSWQSWEASPPSQRREPSAILGSDSERRTVP